MRRQMKGIVLAGGKATRLYPLTVFWTKQLLPVYKFPMIYYTIFTLIKAGIRDILIITAPESYPQYLAQLTYEQRPGGMFTDIKFVYEIQPQPRGLAEAFIIGEEFISDNNVTMILGDNIFIGHDFSEKIQAFDDGALIFAKQVPDPDRLGVVWFNDEMQAVKIIEKPTSPDSDWAVVGLYTYEPDVVQVAKEVQPSARGELEITAINNHYLEQGRLEVCPFTGHWFDAGTPDSLLQAGNVVKEHFEEVII